MQLDPLLPRDPRHSDVTVTKQAANAETSR
jgi:hypothetical protein